MGVVTERDRVEAAFGRPAVSLPHTRARLDGELGVLERDGHVIAISAHRLRLTWVPALDLAHLERLDLGGNGLVELPALPASVRELYIYDNQLERLPALPRLRVLDANRNRLSDVPRLDGIDFVYLASNQLAAAPAMSGCRYVNLSSNPLATLPADAAIQELRLEDAGLAAIPDSIGELAGLRELHLRGNALTEIPAALASCTKLRVLDLRANRLDDLPEALAALPLVKLDLRWNPLRRGPTWIDRPDGALRGALVYT